MRSSRQLSRLSITGHIYEHTPVCVLIEIADAHGIKYEQKDYDQPNFSFHLINSIKQTYIPSIGEIKELLEWQYVARFVNNHVQWTQNKLSQAYNFLIEFMNNEDPLTKIPLNFTAGYQTPGDPFSINACILYKICNYHRLNINARTTVNDMAYAVKLLRDDTEALIRKSKMFIERDANRIALINVLMLSSQEIEDPEPKSESIININYQVVPCVKQSYDLLATIHGSLFDIKTLQGRIEPATNGGSIALAAINFGIDISKSSYPMREYNVLKLNERNNYRPVDPWLAFWYKHNPKIFDLTVTFNPLFPAQFYDNQRLIEMAQTEGYTPNDISVNNPYELLQLAYVSETFHQGPMPNVLVTKTSINLDNLDEIPYGQLLCFGQLDSILKPITIEELIDLFISNENFTSPFTHDAVFTLTAINKLKMIVQNSTGPDPMIRLSSDTLQIRQRLMDAISSVELAMKNDDESIRDLVMAYRNSSSHIKVAIKNTLMCMLNMGMYMRGWCGSGPYPVSKAESSRDKESDIAINVTNSISLFEQSCSKLGKIGRTILDIPLVVYRDGSYQVSTSSSNGYTISQRVDIVKEGDRCGNVSSCIRLSSNWICSTAHKALISVGLPPPFDIFGLRYIS